VIAEAVDLSSGTLAVGVVATLLVTAAAGGAAYATIMGRLSTLADAVKAIGRRLDKHEDAATEHRHDDNDRFQHTEIRLGKIEQVLASDLTPVEQIRPPTDKHRQLRGRTPRPTGDTGPGESR